MILSTIPAVLIFFLPAVVANGAPPVFKDVPYLTELYVPIWPDLLGSHKTWGGLLIYVLVGALFSFPLFLFFSFSWLVAIGIGAWLGFGSGLGDLLGSLIKRIKGLEEGDFALLLDWGDWLGGAWAAGSLFVKPDPFALKASLLLILVVAAVDSFSYRYTPFKDSL